MRRIGAAAAPRWWGVAPIRLPAYLDHLADSGATSVELVVHYGPATRDPSAVHLDRRDWALAIHEAVQRGLHIDVHNSLDERFRLDRWGSERIGLQTELLPILDLLAEVGKRQHHPPVFIVHAADGCAGPESVTSQALGWISSELERRESSAIVCVELRASDGSDDNRFDRYRERLVAFVEAQRSAAIGLCWDVANDWLSARRSGRELAIPSTVPRCVRHVHLHDATADGLLHAPLGEDSVPWAVALKRLGDEGWVGSVTLEIRYRLAHDVGEPWIVLAESVRRALSVRN